MPTKVNTKTWRRTVQAALQEEKSAWSMIWTMAEEAFERDPSYRNFSAGPVIEEIRLELERAGVTMGFDTIKARAVVGKMAHSATKRDSDTLRSVPWTVVLEAYKCGASADATADAIRQGKKTAALINEHFRGRSSPGSSSSTATPRFNDSDAQKTVTDLIAQRRAADADEWQPSAMTKLMWQLLGEILAGTKTAQIDFDAELRALTDAEAQG